MTLIQFSSILHAEARVMLTWIGVNAISWLKHFNNFSAALGWKALSLAWHNRFPLICFLPTFSFSSSTVLIVHYSPGIIIFFHCLRCSTLSPLGSSFHSALLPIFNPPCSCSQLSELAQITLPQGGLSWFPRLHSDLLCSQSTL